VATTLQRIGVAALPLGLLAVGAGLKLGGLKRAPGLAAALLGIRHVVLPAAGIGLALAFMLPSAQRHIVVLFAAMPTASSAYVLAVRMGGDAAYVAGLVTLSTVLGMLSIPLWLAVLQGLGSAL
jgi:predicted permease